MATPSALVLSSDAQAAAAAASNQSGALLRSQARPARSTAAPAAKALASVLIVFEACKRLGEATTKTTPSTRGRRRTEKYSATLTTKYTPMSNQREPRIRPQVTMLWAAAGRARRARAVTPVRT